MAASVEGSGPSSPAKKLEATVEDAQLQELLKSNEFLDRENRLFEAFIARVSPATEQAEEDDEAKQQKKKNPRRAKPDPKQIRPLTVEEKNDITSNEMELLQSQTETIRTKGEKEIDEIKTLIEEVNMRIAEVKKETYEFKRDIIMGADNPRSGKIVAEKLLRFWNDRLKSKDAQVEKLSLKNASLRQQISKLDQQLSHKEEMGEVLHVVDFDQLKIENQQYMSKIEEKNRALLSLKLTTSRTVQVLNNLKHQLISVVSHGESLRSEITEKEKQLSKFEEDYSRSSGQQRKAENTFGRLKFQQEDVEQPQIRDYLRVKAEVTELEHKAIDWRRKIEIAEMENTRLHRVLTTMPSDG
ncbi:hypothetical protein BSKO_12707 [Bryopsis sp. KO-2023]|nr:hypothetical protein BSKO_12707 [Bryopsis sp. KO-2023]